MSIQLIAKGVQDEYFTGSPQTSFFKNVFVRHTDFFLNTKEIPFHSTTFQFGSTQICEISRTGDIIRSITIKVTLPSMFVPTYGYSYPFPVNSRGEIFFYYMDSSFSVVDSYSTLKNDIYYTTKNTSWLPIQVSFNGEKFLFKKTIFSVRYIAFKTTDDALFWGFKSYIGFINGYYVFDFTGSSQQTLELSGWVNSYYPFFRYYNENVGVKTIKSIELYIGGQLVEVISSDWILIYNDLFIPENQQLSVKQLTGGIPVPVTSSLEYYVKIPFSFIIPACALWRQDIRISVNVENPNVLTDTSSIQNFKKTPTFSGQAVGYTGTTTYVVGSSNVNDININLQLSPTSAHDGSNIYVLSYSNLIQVSGNTFQIFNLANCSAFSNSFGIASTPTGFLNYTGFNFQRIISSYITPITNCSLEILNPSIVKTIRDKAWIGTSNSIIIHDIYSNDAETIQFPYGTPKTFIDKAGDVYALTSNALCLIKNNQVTLVNTYTKPVTTGVTDGTNFYIFSESDGVTDAVYSATSNCIYTIGSFNGVKKSNLTSGTTQTFLTSYVFTSILLSSSSNVFLGSGSTLASLSVTNDTTSTASLVNISSKSFMTQSETTVYIVSGSTINTINDEVPFAPTLFTPTLPSTPEPGLLYFDGRFVYSVPVNGTQSLARYDTTIPFTNSCGHTSVNISNNIYAGTINTDGKRRVVIFPSNLDGNVIIYSTFFAFENPNSFSRYELDTFRSGQNFTASQFANDTLFIGSTNKICRYTPTEQSNVISYDTSYTSGFSGIAYDEKEYAYVFPNVYRSFPLPGSSQFIKLLNLVNNAISNVFLYPQDSSVVYNSITQLNPRTVITFPSTAGDVLQFYLDGPSTTFENLGTCAVENASNCSCIAGSNVYSFPDQGSSLVYMFDTVSSTLSSFYMTPGNYKQAQYDGKRYIYLISNGFITRFDTLRDQFIDLSGHTTISLGQSNGFPTISMTEDNVVQNGFLVSGSSGFPAFGAFQTTVSENPPLPAIPQTPVTILFASPTPVAKLGVSTPSLPKWGPMTAYNSPTFHSGSPPYVEFAGGQGPSSQYMSGEIQVPNASTQGRTVCAYINIDNAINYDYGVPTRFFMSGSYDGILVNRNFQGIRSTGFSFTTRDTPYKEITATGWVSLCWRAKYVPGGVDQDIFENGVKLGDTEFQENALVTSSPFVSFAQSEYADIFNDPYWSGKLNALLVYDRALTNEEISAVHTAFVNQNI